MSALLWRAVKLLLLLAMLAVGAQIVLYYLERLPANTLPWKPVVLDAPPRWLARFQLNHLKRDGDACRAALKRSALQYTSLADRRLGEGCGFHNVVRMTRAPIGASPHITATCGLAAALYWYEQELQAAALQEFHQKLVRIGQLGTFACRNVNAQTDSRRSEHATANAIDIASFRLADGRVISVLRDFGKPTPAGRFLNVAHERACTLFNTVLGPNYNTLHANHFHLDMGSYRICS